MSIKLRLAALEKTAAVALGDTIWLLCVSHDGIVLDHGSEVLRPWVGRHFTEVPHPIAQLIVGVDPLVVTGEKPYEPAAQTGPGTTALLGLGAGFRQRVSASATHADLAALLRARRQR